MCIIIEGVVYMEHSYFIDMNIIVLILKTFLGGLAFQQPEKVIFLISIGKVFLQSLKPAL